MDGWDFLLDENIDPKTAAYLSREGISADHVRDALWLGADDEADILPYAENNGLIVVTSDVSDFASRTGASPGIVLVFDDTMCAYQVASSLLPMTEVYQDPDVFPGMEVLDDWV